MRRLRRFFELARAEQWLLLQTVGWLAIARTMLVFIPFSRLSERLSSPIDSASARLDPAAIARIGWAVRVAANRVPWRADCFPQAIAARILLDRLGQASTIHIGVAREANGALSGHAWLTCGDQVVTGGDGLDRYVVLHRLSGENVAP